MKDVARISAVSVAGPTTLSVILLGLVRECDDTTLRSLTDLVRAGLALSRRPHVKEES